MAMAHDSAHDKKGAIEPKPLKNIFNGTYLDFFLVLGTPRGERSPLEPEGSNKRPKRKRPPVPAIIKCSFDLEPGRYFIKL